MYENLYRELETSRASWSNEEELRHNWISALEKELGIRMDLERGKRDSSYNNVIIEFKAKGLFQGTTESAKFLEAKDERLKKYIVRAAKKDSRPENEYIGIGIDGNHIFFAQVIDGEIVHGPLLPVTEISVGMVADALKNNFRRVVNKENLVDDFGLMSEVGATLMQLFANKVASSISTPGPNKIKMLFEEWQALYGQIADLEDDAVDEIHRNIGFTLPRAAGELQIPVALFAIHTYNSLLIKLLAAEIVASHGLTSYSYFSQSALSYNDAELLRDMDKAIEEGQLFSRAGVNGFVEEAIFSWYLDACADIEFHDLLVPALRRALGKLALYRTDDLEAAQSKDVLKQVYQHLVPEALRKSLGEYYTPDWLVKISLDKVEPESWVGTRVLDPTCGSATFLLEVIRRKREAGSAAGLSPGSLLDDITRNVWGFDLNPLAVQTARVNFLISVADLLKQTPGHTIELPILLADAVYSPARNPADGEDVVRYRIGSQVADLEIVIPAALAFDRKRLDDVFNVLGKCVDRGEEFEKASTAMLRSRVLSELELREWGAHLRETYNRVLDLHKRDWNGIWFRIVRNFFWSATAEQFDIVSGNPPWVRWSKLPELYRQRVKPTCEQYDIFASTKYHGGNELDISALITYTVADKWLKPEGDMVFVIPQNHFQLPSSAGFRKFKIKDEYNLVPREVDDLKSLVPFTGTTNRTAVVVFKKTAQEEVTYPVPYREWRAQPGTTRGIPETLSKDEVLNRVQITDMEAAPVGGLSTPWNILLPGRYAMLDRLRGKSTWVQGRKGITTDMNPLYFVDVVKVSESEGIVQIQTRPESGKGRTRRMLGPKQKFWVESEALYPLLKGASDFSACRITIDHELFTFVPNAGIKRTNFADSEDLMARSPRLLTYFEAFDEVLENRSSYRLRLSKQGAPFFSIYTVGPYSFAPWKVVWAEQGKFQAAVIGMGSVPWQEEQKPFVPDHKIFFVEFSEPEPAYYLCGLLNAEAVKEYIESHTIGTQIGDVFKHMSLPRFDSTIPEHIELGKAARFAHECPMDQYEEALATVRRLAETVLFPAEVSETE